MKRINCKFCGKEDRSNMQGYCQRCYHYFVTEKKQIYTTPPYGEIWYAPNGDCICPICGQAYTKLGAHFWQAHNITSKEAHKKVGWDINAKATNVSYRILMKNKLQKKCVTDNLIKKGMSTRFISGHPGRLRNVVSAMTLRRLKQSSFIKYKEKDNSMNKVNELLNIIDLTNIEKLKVNNIVYPKATLLAIYGNHEFKKVFIETKIVSMDESHIECDLICEEDVEELATLVQHKLELPNSPNYISIELNIIL